MNTTTQTAPTPTAGRTPPRTYRTYAKEVRTRTEQWSFSNGNRQPRGYGNWAFAPTAAYRADNGSQAGRDFLQGATAYHKGTYTEAKRAAAAFFATQHETDLTLLP